MPVRVFWDDEDPRIFRWEIRGRWTWDEFFQAQARVSEMLESIDFLVDIVFDMRGAEGLPPNMMSNIKRVMDAGGAHTAAIVILGADDITRYMFRTFAGVFRLLVARYTIFFAGSLDEARRFIATDRARRTGDA